MDNTVIPPRILRANQAHGYLGMCRDEFNKTVRPYVREFPIGLRGVGFDRLELDAWADRYIEINAIPKSSSGVQRPLSEGRIEPLSKSIGHGLPTTPGKRKSEYDFEKALDMVRNRSESNRSKNS